MKKLAEEEITVKFTRHPALKKDYVDTGTKLNSLCHTVFNSETEKVPLQLCKGLIVGDLDLANECKPQLAIAFTHWCGPNVRRAKTEKISLFAIAALFGNTELLEAFVSKLSEDENAWLLIEGYPSALECAIYYNQPDVLAWLVKKQPGLLKGSFLQHFRGAYQSGAIKSCIWLYENADKHEKFICDNEQKSMLNYAIQVDSSPLFEWVWTGKRFADEEAQLAVFPNILSCGAVNILEYFYEQAERPLQDKVITKVDTYLREGRGALSLTIAYHSVITNRTIFRQLLQWRQEKVLQADGNSPVIQSPNTRTKPERVR